MFRTIVVGTDGRESGEDAIAFARTLADADAEIILAEIVVTRRFAGRGANRDHDAGALDDARARVGTRAAGLEGAARTGSDAVPAASVGEGLAEIAARHDADLIVVGSSARTAMGRLLTGDDTQDVLHHARCPVAVAPRGYAGEDAGAITHIGVGYNESAESEHALDLAIGMREQHHARLEVMEILPPPWPVDMTWAGVPTLHEERKRAEAKLLEMPAVDASKVLVAASAHHELRDLAARSTLLVVGARPASAFGRFALGSTSDALTHDLPCGLLVVPRVSAAVGRQAPLSTPAG